MQASLHSADGVACLPGTRRIEAAMPAAAVLDIAEEVPVGFVYNGFPYAVMMATPADLDDFAVGFSLAEGLINGLGDMRAVSARASEEGIELAIELAPNAFAGFLQRRRVRALRGHTSCGLCGIEEIAQLARPAPRGRVDGSCASVDPAAVRRAVAALRDFQPLGRATRCAHAAAWTDPDGRLALVREDVGRHNALDKLVGACLRGGVDTASRILPGDQPLLVRDGAEGDRGAVSRDRRALGADRARDPHRASGRPHPDRARSRPPAGVVQRASWHGQSCRGMSRSRLRRRIFLRYVGGAAAAPLIGY
jgi:formate dehydrogenase accessory protein FdhD